MPRATGWRIRLLDGDCPWRFNPKWDLLRAQRPAGLYDDVREQKTSLLFGVPAEIRLQIYRLVFSQMRLRWGYLPPDQPLRRGYSGGEFVIPDADIALLRVCKKMHAEIGDSWLGQILFLAEDQNSLIAFLDANPAVRRLIRRVVVREHPGGCPQLTTAPSDDGTTTTTTTTRSSASAAASSSWSSSSSHIQPGDDAHSLMGTSLDAVPLSDALCALPGLRLDTLTVLSCGEPWSAYRSLDRFVARGRGWRVLRFAAPHSLLLKRGALLARGSRICRPAGVLPRAPQPGDWDGRARARDGGGVRLFRALGVGSGGGGDEVGENRAEGRVLRVVGPDAPGGGGQDGQYRYYYYYYYYYYYQDQQQDGLLRSSRSEVSAAVEDGEEGGPPGGSAARLGPFAVLEPRLRSEWAQTLGPDDFDAVPAGSPPPPPLQAAERELLEADLARELLFVVTRGTKGADQVAVPGGRSEAEMGRDWWPCCVSGTCWECEGRWEEGRSAAPGRGEGGQAGFAEGLTSSAGREVDGGDWENENADEDEYEFEEDDEEEDEEEEQRPWTTPPASPVYDDGALSEPDDAGTGDGFSLPPAADQEGPGPGQSSTLSGLLRERAERQRRTAQQQQRTACEHSRARTAAQAFLENFRFLYPYDGTFMDAMMRHELLYAVRRDMYSWGRAEDFGTWGIFGAVDRHLYSGETVG